MLLLGIIHWNNIWRLRGLLSKDQLSRRMPKTFRANETAAEAETVSAEQDELEIQNGKPDYLMHYVLLESLQYCFLFSLNTKDVSVASINDIEAMLYHQLNIL